MQRDRIALPNDAVVIYAVGDVHGCYSELIELERRIVADGHRSPKRKIVVMLGDYVDRGRYSAAVIDHLMRGMPEGFTRICLCGNHEQMMLRFLDDPIDNAAWLDYGGAETMLSYGLDIRWLMSIYRDQPKEIVRILREVVPEDHIAFMRGLPVLAFAQDLVFAHAGLRPGVPLHLQSDLDLLWIREPFLSQGPGMPLIVIHGHTPTLKPALAQNRLCLDTKAYATGRLTAVRCEGRKARFISVAGG